MFQEFTGAQYLKIDIANNFGLDKLTWDQRIEWFDDHEAQLPALIVKAEKPAMFYAGTKAWEAYLAGEASGYPITLDGCSSGLQILACLVGDRKAAELCNVVDTGDRKDAYTEIFTRMRSNTNEAFSRSDLKQAVMTALYGSTAEPERVFGAGTALLDLFYTTMATEAPGAWELNTAFLGMWNPEALSYDWVMPDNFHVHIKVMGKETEDIIYEGATYEISQAVNAPQKVGRSLSANATHSTDGYIVRELVRRCSYDPEQVMRAKVALCAAYDVAFSMTDENVKMVTKLWNQYKKTGMLSARILKYITEDSIQVVSDRGVIWTMISRLPTKPFSVITIHDAFRVLPNYGNDLRRQYNQLLSEVAHGTLLNSIVGSILGRDVDCGKLDDTLWKDILDTNYALS